MNDVLDGDCLLSQVNTPNDTLKNTQSSTVQVDGLAQPLLVHFAILTQGCLKSLEFILEKRRPTQIIMWPQNRLHRCAAANLSIAVAIEGQTQTLVRIKKRTKEIWRTAAKSLQNPTEDRVYLCPSTAIMAKVGEIFPWRKASDRICNTCKEDTIRT